MCARNPDASRPTFSLCLIARLDIPARVIITEYVDVANAFFDGAQPGLVNGVLDTLARRLRPDEFGGANPKAENGGQTAKIG